jgi:uncharacterized protein YjbJ (UPF0337 family)
LSDLQQQWQDLFGNNHVQVHGEKEKLEGKIQ